MNKFYSEDILKLIENANKNGVIISFENEKLNVNILKGKAIDKALLSQLKENKEQLIQYFRKYQSKDNTIASIADLHTEKDVAKDEALLSYSQESLWVIDQLEGSVPYHIPIILDIKGSLDTKALKYALNEVVNRHEVLRTVVKKGAQDKPVQELLAKDSWLQNFKIDNNDSIRISADLWIKKLIKQPFNLSKDHMLRAHLLQSNENNYTLVLIMHHIASDGWSMPIFVEEIKELYEAKIAKKEAKLSPIPYQYKDYAHWQRTHFESDSHKDKLDYWHQKLKGVDPINLTPDFPRPAVQSHKGKSVDFHIDSNLSEEIKNLANREGASLFMTLLTAFKVLLYKYSGQEDICVGSVIANRTEKEVENLIGYFVNTFALRSDLSDDPSFSALLAKVKHTTLEAYEHQEVPFDKVVQLVEKKRDQSRTPIFQVLFTLQNKSDLSNITLGDTIISQQVQEQDTVKYDLTFTVSETAEGLQLNIQYCTKLFMPDTIERMQGHFKQILSQISSNPTSKLSDIDILTSQETKLLLSDFSTSSHEYPKDKTVIGFFEEQVEKTPDNIALISENQRLTYKQLNNKVNQLAHYLRAKGVKEESKVTICMQRSMEVILSILGVVKAGAAFVPIDPEYPEDRINYIIQDTGSQWILSNQKCKELIDLNDNKNEAQLIIIEDEWDNIAKQDTHNPETYLKTENLIYLIYTSGSTGRPKGVMLEHRNLMDHLFDMIPVGNLSNCKSFALTSSVAADGGHSILFASFMLGSTMHILSDDTLLDTSKMSAYLEKYSIDCMKTVPSLWSSYADDGLLLLPNETLILGGEAFSLKIVKQLKEANYKGHVYNNYGPTETTIGKLMHLVDVNHEYANVPIGIPLSNTQLYVVNQDDQLCPIGVPGELWIGGDGVSRGYLNRDELTNEKFIQNPFGNSDGRVYKSGDFVKWLPDGNIEFLGRIDHQVQIRGYRVELGEIETVLQQCPLVSQGVVLAKDDPNGNKRLIAYIIPNEKYDKEGIQQYLKDRLPDYMVPALMMELSEFPLTTNAKVDKRALPDPDAGDLLASKFVGPRNDNEKLICDIWQQLLKVEQVGIHDNFFELGGHSLLATRVVSAIRSALKTELPIKALFTHPTVASLSDHLADINQASLLPEIKRQKRPELIPLSFSQERLWFIDKLEGSTHYHVPTLLRLKGKIDKILLQKTFSIIVNRHEVLRTTFNETKGKPYQEIKEQGLWSLEVAKKPNAHSENILKSWVEKEIAKPYDLSKDHMLRAQLLEVSRDEALLLICFHHIASDGWSVSVFVEEFINIYKSLAENKPISLKPLSVQYTDFALWQRNHLEGNILNKKLKYWSDKLTGVSPLNIPTDFQRPAEQSTNGHQLHFKIGQDLTDQVNKLAKNQNATLFMTLLSVFKVLLHKYSGQTDICVGSPIANRTQKAVEKLIGFFVNTLALRTDLSENPSFYDLLDQIKNTTLEAYANQEVPFERIVEQVQQDRDQSRNPIFQVMFILQNTPETPDLKLPGLQFEFEELEHKTSKFDIIFNVVEGHEGLDITIEYCTDLFEEKTICQLMEHFDHLLQAVVNNPKQKIGTLQMLSENEITKLESFSANATTDTKGKSVIGLFESQVVKTPHKKALSFEGQSLSYLELNEKANQLTHHLIENGVKSNTQIGVCLDRSLEMVVGILAILKTGNAYVPLDPTYPKERIGFILEDTQIDYIISKSGLTQNIKNSTTKIVVLDKLSIENYSTTNPSRSDIQDPDCYLIFTSGSTGRPKGVQMGNEALVNLLEWQQSQFDNKTERKALQFASLNFDVSFQEIFSTLCFGGTLFLISEEDRKDANILLTQIEDHQITHLFLPFVALDNLAEVANIENSFPKGLEEVITAGEQLKLTNSIKRFIDETSIKLINQYGPSETHVASYYEVKTEDLENRFLPPIGKPISNTSLYVLDAHQEICGVKITGELYIGGLCLAKGYINQQELTAERFVEVSIQGKTHKLYNTGDLVRWLSDGNLEYIGRIDQQVKIRGHRVELAEIETVINKISFVKQAIVKAVKDKQGFQKLIAYVVSDQPIAKEQLDQLLKDSLPEYMIPAVYVELDTIPVTSNGKVDHTKLTKADIALFSDKKAVLPRNKTEELLASIWSELLDIEKIGIHDNFFDLGGHSLLATRVISAIRTKFEIEIPLKELFSFPTIAKLAIRVDKKERKGILPAIKVQERPENIPLSFSQERLWFIDQLEGSTHYHMSAAFRLKGKVEINLIAKALQEIVKRHEILRTVYIQKEETIYQQIMDADRWELETTDINFTHDLQEEINSFIQQPFDLQHDYMLRVKLLKLGSDEMMLVFAIHHIASDGWSVSVFINEFIELYKTLKANRENSLKPLPIQYADYAIFQRAHLTGSLLNNKLNYWAKQLNNTTPLNFPTDYSRGSEQSKKGKLLSFQIDKSLKESLYSLSQKEGSTLFMTMLAAFKVLLYRYTDQEDICVGTPIANRMHAETEDLIGFFVNTLALRSDLSKNPSFTNLLENVKETTLDAYAHQEIPFEKIVSHIEPERNMSQSPLFQVLFVMQNNPKAAALVLDDVEMIPEDTAHETSKFDFSFNIAENDGGFDLHIEYCDDLFKEDTIQILAEHYINLLEAVTQNPQLEIAALQMLTKNEENQLVKSFNNNKKDFSLQGSMLSLFSQQAVNIPEEFAVLEGEEEITYRDLDEKSNQLANYLINKGVSDNSLVGLCLDRSYDMVVAMFAILKTGAAYVPIDPNYPKERIQFILDDAQAGFIISNQKYHELLSGRKDIQNIELDTLWDTVSQFQSTAPVVQVLPDQLAYVIYTSGSTGKPKGVMISHHNAENFIHWCKDEFSQSNFDVVYAVTSICFDLSIFEIFFTLSQGKKLRILENALAIPQWIENDTNILLNTVPSVVSSLLDQKVSFGQVNVLNMAGEPIPSSIPEKLDLKRIEVRNLYGPSEDTTYSTVFRLNEEQPILIGKPITNTELYVLGHQLQLLPVGSIGEICLGGDGLSKGYLNHPKLTDERFINHPFSNNKNQKLYRTGDLARWLPDGNLEYLGRIDDQLKIRGYRIEPGEIENTLQAYSEIKNAVVLPKADGSGSIHLVAYLIAETGLEITQLKESLRKQLPDYMVPAMFMKLEAFPMTPNGKVDKKQLAGLDADMLIKKEYVAPKNNMETALCNIWKKVLQVEKVGTQDDFFELGGHSLLATKLASIIQREFELNIPIKVLFQFTTVAALAKYIQVLENQKQEEEEEDCEVFEI